MTNAVTPDEVDRPSHYNSHPSGVECAAITEHMTCMIGCAVKYLWRHGIKPGVDADTDLRKATWCIERERQRLARQRRGDELDAVDRNLWRDLSRDQLNQIGEMLGAKVTYGE